MRHSNNLANCIHCPLCAFGVWVSVVEATWSVWAVTRQRRELVYIAASITHTDTRKHTYTHQSVLTLRGFHVERSCNLLTMGSGLFVFTSLSKLLDFEVVRIIKFVKGVGGKEQHFRGNSVGNQAYGWCSSLKTLDRPSLQPDFIQSDI